MAINNKKLLDELGVDKLTELLKSYTTNSVDAVKQSLDPPFTRGEVPPITKGVYDYTRANRLMFLPADQIIVEQSTDAGVTWISANISDVAKKNVFSQLRNYTLAIPLKNGIRSCDCMLRVTITGMKYNVPDGTAETNKYNYWSSNYVLSNERYCSLSGSFFWVNAVNDCIHCKYESATGANPNGWVVKGEGFMSGWSGLNYVKTYSGTFGGDPSQIYNDWNHRFTFRTATIYYDFDNSKLQTGAETYHQSIMEITAFGDNVWTAANYMMRNNHLYSWDENGTMVVDNRIYATGNIQSANYISAPTLYEGGTALSYKYASRELIEDIQEAMADYQDQFVAIGQELTEMNVDVNCDHRYEITGNTGDEHGLAIADQQMLINKISGRTLDRNQLLNRYFQGTDTSINAWVVDSNNVFTFNYTNNTGKTQYENVAVSTNSNRFIVNHKYALLIRGSITNFGVYFSYGDYQAAKSSSTIFTCVEYLDLPINLLCFIPNGNTISGTASFEVIDLTLAYGQGNEPTTVEDVLNDFPEYIPYDEGTLVHSNNKLISTGKNLFNYQNAQIIESYIDSNYMFTESTVTRSIIVKCIPNTTYTISKSLGERLSVASFNNIPVKNQQGTKPIVIQTYKSYYITTSTNDNYLVIYFYHTTHDTLSIDEVIKTIQIEYGNTPTEYEPYKEEVIEFVGDLKEWDYKDNQSGNDVFGTGELDLGALDWVYTTDDNGNPYFYSGTVSEIKPIPYSSFKGNIICSKYTNVPYVDLYYGDYKCIALVNQAPRIAIRDYSYTTVSSLKSALQGVKLLYEKATPTIVENYNFPAGMAVYKGGMQIQEGTIPYLIEKQYALSIKSQVLQNIEIDREQQKQIDSLEHSVIEAYTKSTLVEYNLNKAIVDYELPYLKDRIIASNSRIKALEDWSGTIVGGGGGTVDLSNYVTIDTHNRLSGEVTDLEEYIREVDNTVEGIQELVNDFNSDISTLYNLSQDLAQKEYPLDQIEYYVQEPNSAAIRLSHDVQINLYQIQGALDIYLSGHRCILINIPDDEITIYSDTSLSGSATIYNYANIPHSCFTWIAKSGIGFEGLRSAGISEILVEFVNNCFIIRNVYVGEM